MNEFDNDKRREQLDAIGRQMRDGIDSKIRRRRVRNRALVGAATFAACGVIAVGALAQLPGGGADPVAPAAAEVLENAARAAELFSPTELGPNQYLYSKTTNVTKWGARDPGTSLSYFADIEQEDEEWIAADYSGWERHAPGRGPLFLTEQDHANWAASGSPRFPEGITSGKGAEGPEPAGTYDIPNYYGVKKFELPKEDLSSELLDTYDIEEAELARLSRTRKRFNRYVHGHVAAVTRRLSDAKVSKRTLRKRTDKATFSLATELLAQPGADPATVKAGLLRLAAGSDYIKVEVDVKDRLGRSGIAVTQDSKRMIFDPATFVTLQVEDAYPPLTPATMPIRPWTIGIASTYEYGVVDQLRKRPDGSMPPRLGSLSQLPQAEQSK